MTDIKTQLAQELAEVEWRDLQPHAKRDAVILVNEALNLVEVGVALANDQATLVQAWIAEQLIQKPSQQQLSDWNENPTQQFNTLIVQPFVLIQS